MIEMTLSSSIGCEIRALAVWGRARYLSVTEAPHNTDFHTWMGKKHFCFFQTAEGGGPRVVVSTTAFHARVRGSAPGLGGLKETPVLRHLLPAVQGLGWEIAPSRVVWDLASWFSLRSSRWLLCWSHLAVEGDVESRSRVVSFRFENVLR